MLHDDALPVKRCGWTDSQSARGSCVTTIRWKCGRPAPCAGPISPPRIGCRTSTARMASRIALSSVRRAVKAAPTVRFGTRALAAQRGSGAGARVRTLDTLAPPVQEPPEGGSPGDDPGAPSAASSTERRTRATPSRRSGRPFRASAPPREPHNDQRRPCSAC